MINDIRYAVRTLGRNPGFTVVAVLRWRSASGRTPRSSAWPTRSSSSRCRIRSPNAALTGLLAAIGLYGVMAYLVQLRTREIGIRVALGATPGGVLRETMSGGLRYAVPGITIGAVMAAVLSRVSISRVPGLQQADITTLALSAGAMLCLSMLAILIPARRAGRIDP